MNEFDRDDFVKVKGLAQVYQNKQQFTIHKIRRLEDPEVEPADYFPCSKRDPEEMWTELQGIIASFKNPHLRSLLELIFADPKTAALYKRAPAAKSIHHACLGGLIEHVLSLCGLCRMMAAHYQDVDLDLLLTAAMLHDIGKIEELSYDRSFSYTAAGQLVGHIVMGLQMVGTAIGKLPDFPPKLKLLLEHTLLSHHGELEFGSPKVPMFPEALLFHHLDNLDSKFEAMRVSIQRDRQPDNEFTGWISSLERVVLKKDIFLRPPAPPVTRAPQKDEPEVEQPKPHPASHPTPHPTPAAPIATKPEPPAAPKPAPRPTPTSPFAEKLQAVLGGSSKQ
jgi:3'-5' exoribonuclease